jgi:hypothetical protein
MNNTYYYHTRSNDNGRRATFAGILNKATNTIAIGLAVCSNRDQFQKRVGREISTVRAANHPLTIVPLVADIKPGIAFRKVAEIYCDNNKNDLVKLVK